MNRLMRVVRGTKGCFLMCVLSCVVADCAWLYMVTVSLLAGSEPAVRPVSHFGMDIEDAKQYPWLEYSVWQDQEWVRIYTPGQPQLWQPEETVPDLPDNSFREWKRPLVGLVNTVRRGQFATGSIKDTNAFFLALSPSPHIKPMMNHLLTCRIRTQPESRKCSPMPPLFLTVIARLLCNSLQSSMATPVMLIVVIFRSRLLSGLGQFRIPLAAVDILANDRDTKLSM